MKTFVNSLSNWPILSPRQVNCYVPTFLLKSHTDNMVLHVFTKVGTKCKALLIYSPWSEYQTCSISFTSCWFHSSPLPFLPSPQVHFPLYIPQYAWFYCQPSLAHNQLPLTTSTDGRPPQLRVTRVGQLNRSHSERELISQIPSLVWCLSCTPFHPKLIIRIATIERSIYRSGTARGPRDYS